MEQTRKRQGGRRGAGEGQSMIEMVLVLPFFMLMVMVLAEFVVYFYRSNQLENAAQTAGRLASRGASADELEAHLDEHLTSLNPKLTVRNADGAVVRIWSPEDKIKLGVRIMFKPLFPVGALNVFSPDADFFPGIFILESVKTVLVE
ncbi:pilus assembly protein [bacterium]|nr:pilus assembly protein [bacterium]